MLKKYKSKNYLNQIVVSMFIFFTLISIPFSYAVYHLAEKTYLETTNNTNRKLLQQMRFNFDYNRDTVGSVMQSIYHQSSVTSLLYNEDIEGYQIYSTLDGLKKNVLSANPSLHSIYIYNQNSDSMVSVEASGDFKDRQLIEFMEKNKPLTRMQPYLRKVQRSPDDPDTYIYVFTYFIYDFEGSDSQPQSFLAVNQRTNWILDNLVTMNKPSGGSSEFLLIDGEGNICNNNVKIENNEEYQAIIREFLAKENQLKEQNEDGLGFYTAKIKESKYLISYVNIGSYNNHILSIQEYDQVFHALNQLRRNFILCTLVLFGFSMMLLWILAKRIYRPINNLVKDVSSLLPPDTKEAVKENEFDYLKNAYVKISEKYVSIENQTLANQDIVAQYYLENLLLSSQEQNIDKLRKKFAGHWIFEAGMRFCVLVIRLDDEKYILEHNTVKEKQLLVFGVQNILLELLKTKVECEVARVEENSFVVLLGGRDAGRIYAGDLKESVLECQKYVKEYFNITFSLAFSEADSDKYKISAMYRQAEQAMDYRFALGRAVIIDWKECTPNIQNAELFDPKELASEMAAKAGDAQVRESVILQLSHEIQKLNYDNMVIVLLDFLTALKYQMDHMRTCAVDVETFDFRFLFKSVTNMEYLDDIMDLIRKRFEEAFSSQKKEADTKEVNLVKTVTEYMNRNYMDSSFCLNMIADELGISSKYLASVFKKHTGMSVGEYMLSARMVKAAEMMADSNQTITSIANKVGMENESYFYRMFKKYYGCTPREYAIQCKMEKIAKE
ncbi:helix-turn-helix domain-containing protein [Robinsoniella peoriensis]|uniref:HTH-type transcriptional regulator YesS n=1 Tax=Robinsoniella peoriensis TaxID=180332 RepID=A0A4U8Q5M7_9FIRM|nr:helix-turn-helix domain-containing protein [Robinsoniella peoriensis]TLD00047.1 HTH-type transcriptional regulator YesS [Robinsoniella peoriensis]